MVGGWESDVLRRTKRKKISSVRLLFPIIYHTNCFFVLLLLLIFAARLPPILAARESRAERIVEKERGRRREKQDVRDVGSQRDHPARGPLRGSARAHDATTMRDRVLVRVNSPTQQATKGRSGARR